MMMLMMPTCYAAHTRIAELPRNRHRDDDRREHERKRPSNHFAHQYIEHRRPRLLAKISPTVGVLIRTCYEKID